MASSPRFRAGERDRPAFSDSLKNSFAARNSLKRSLDDRERDDHERQRHAGASRSPPSVDRNASPDHYSPRASVLDSSPPNIRHAFMPDRRDHESPKQDRSLNPAHLHGRRDRYAPSRRLSPPRKLSPPRQPSSRGQDVTGASDRPRPEVNTSPTHIRRESESVAKPYFKNLSWKAPTAPPRQPSDSNVPRGRTLSQSGSPASPEQNATQRLSNGNLPERINFNGVEGVPTGPRPKLGAMPPTLPPINENVKRRPHIFISAECLPPLKPTVKHLQGYLNKFVLTESSIVVDQTGYYVLFEDSETDRKRLNLCYNTKRDGMLFSQHKLKMVCRPDGCSNADGRGIDNAGNTNTAITTPSTETAASAQAFCNNHVTRPMASVSESHKAKDPRLQLRGGMAVSNSNVESPTDTPGLPLRVPSRQDKEDASSSISGFTSSDISASKPSQCHMCKETQFSEADALIQCSSCPRRYHRWCHTRPPIPPNLELDHAWQCRRCIKKQIQSKSRLSGGSLATSVSPAPSVGQPEEPPAKRIRLDGAEITVADGLTASEAHPESFDANHARGNSAHDVTPINELEQLSAGSLLNGNLLAEEPHVKSDDSQLNEADDLVAQSFTRSGARKAGSMKPDKPVKLTFVRKKLTRPEVSSAVQGAMNTSVAGDDTPGEPNNQLPDHNDESATPKRKSHKWAGGGADKDIIRAGESHLFPVDESSSNGEQPTEAIDSEVLPPDELVPNTLEVPESPGRYSQNTWTRRTSQRN